MKHLLLFSISFCLLVSCTKKQENLPNAPEILSIIDNVNQHWMAEHPLMPSDSLPFHPYSDNSPFWHNAAYHTGNMEAYKLTQNPEYLAYSKAWAESNLYIGATGTDSSLWEYHYGETPDHVLFGDWQICFQTYCDLYEIEPDPAKIARAREVMEFEMNTPNNDYWWWADGLYMVMPTMTKLYKITSNGLYLDKLYEFWSYSKDLMYDYKTELGDTLQNTPEHLFYRDGKYLYPNHTTANGSKDFWARGCGWVVAGLAKVLQDVPAEWEHRSDFFNTYIEMCEAVKNCQQEDGYWTRSLLDPEQAPGPETSGTAFFTYGLAWGINNNIIDRNTYLPVVLKAWEYLTKTALQEDGCVGYVQPIGEKAIPGQVVDTNSTANFGVGAFLLAACEMYKLVAE